MESYFFIKSMFEIETQFSYQNLKITCFKFKLINENSEKIIIID